MFSSVDRVRILAHEVLKDFKDKFGVDFKENKIALEEISVITSKELKNEIVGYITKFIKHENLDQKIKKEKEKQFDDSSNDEIKVESPPASD